MDDLSLNFPPSLTHRTGRRTRPAISMPPVRCSILPRSHSTYSQSGNNHRPIVRAGKPGGTLVFDHYCHRFSEYLKTVPLIHLWLRRQPPEIGLIWTERLVRSFFPLHRAVRHSWLGQKLVAAISPVLTYFRTSPNLPDELHYELALLDTHDSLSDFYKHRRTRRHIGRPLEDLGAQQIWCKDGGKGVEARAKGAYDGAPSPIPVRPVKLEIS